jgi:hypothetical protein
MLSMTPICNKPQERSLEAQAHESSGRKMDQLELIDRILHSADKPSR